MNQNEKKRLYPIRNAADPRKIEKIEVSEEVYRALYPDIWRTLKKMKALGQCTCPKSKFCDCDGDCLVCEYHAAGNQISLDASIDGTEGISLADTVADSSPSVEDIAIHQQLLDAINAEIESLDPKLKLTYELLKDHSEREVADILNISPSAVHYRWDRLVNLLSARFKK